MMPSKDDIKKLITESSRRLQKLKEQQSRLGINTPPETSIEIEDIEAELAQLQTKLKSSSGSTPETSPFSDTLPEKRISKPKNDASLKRLLRQLLSDPNNLTSPDFNTLIADFEADNQITRNASRKDQVRELVEYIFVYDQVDEFVAYLQQFPRIRKHLN